MANNRDDTGLSGIGDILKGVGKLIGGVADVVDKDSFKKHFSGEMFKTRNSNTLNGKYNFSVKLGLDKEDDVGFSQKPVYCVPQAAIFNDVDRLTVILELPGVEKDSLRFRIDGSTLVIDAEGTDVSYRKEINIDDSKVSAEDISITENNGIFKLVLKTGVEDFNKALEDKTK